MHNTRGSTLSAARLQVCEGLTKRFHAVGFKKNGKKLAVLKAGGCLGKSAIALAPPVNKSRGGDDAELEWPPQMPEARAQIYAPMIGTGALAASHSLGCVLRQRCLPGCP